MVVGPLNVASATRPSPTSRRLIPSLLLIGALIFGLAALGVATTDSTGGVAGGTSSGPRSQTTATLAVGEPSTLDPAAQGDLSSAVVISQLFEGLTAFDPGLNVRPALASSWDVSADGTQIVFHLRPGLAFSDGTPIHGADVVRSWMRLLDPKAPSPLLSLISDVQGAIDYAAGRIADPSSVGITATGDDVVVHLNQPSPDFASVVASSSFVVVPSGVGSDAAALKPGTFVGSGAYVLSAATSDTLTLKANPHYWAGPPAIPTISLLTTLHGKSPVSEFENGDLDYAPISDADASWIQYDATLGPNLRVVPSLGVTYYGFDVTKAPFDDVRVRQAFAQGVDWKSLVTLAGPASQVPATSMVPTGIPGHPTKDYSPVFDPAAARKSLADAGYPNGAGFPAVTLVTSGDAIDPGIVAQLKTNLGITVGIENMDGNDYFERIAVDPPAFWTMSWAADYPGANDFLGVLLGSGQSNNYGHWASSEFDEALADAGVATTPDAVAAAYDHAQTVVQREVPVIPVSYGTGWALSRTGLLGAGQNGLGVPRLAGLAWSK
jgi:oligopeptide transport system substrate-binding protein